jgi:hypothetical protein
VRPTRRRHVQASGSEPEIHLFLLWSNALHRSKDIIADIRSRFTIRSVVSVEWSREHFAQNLTRFYGQSLVAGSEKEIHCGVGPFLVVVVEDRQPSYARQKTSRGKAEVNASMFHAKRRYRRWTGGGHRVHATLTARESDKDIFLLLGRRAASYEIGASGEWDGTILAERRDLIGANGWKSRSELLTALEASIGYVALADHAEEADDAILALLVDDRWWAARIANGVGDDDEHLRVLVAEDQHVLVLSEPGDGSLDHVWQRELKGRAERNSDGVLVPGPVDRFYLTLEDVAVGRRELSPSGLELLDALARQHELPRGDYGDVGFASAAVDEYLKGLRERSDAEPPVTSSKNRSGLLMQVLGRRGRRSAG